MLRCSRLAAVSVVVLGAIAGLPPEPARAQASPPSERVNIGKSLVALDGPGRFSVGDSPVDPSTHAPVWAQPSFDDSKWETVDLNAGPAEVDPISGMSGFAAGWTNRGHPGYWGYAWYRIRVQLDTLPGQRLALAGPADVDDVYQAFANGTLLGSFGDFSTSHPVAYYSQPKMFLLPQLSSAGSTSGERLSSQPPSATRVTAVIAFRVWMEPNSLVNQPDAGGFHDAPIIGEAGSVTAGYQLRWLELVRAYIFRFIEGIVYTLLALVVGCLMLFDNKDPVYRWIVAVIAGLAVQNLIVGLVAWTQLLQYQYPEFVQNVLLTPSIFAGWVMVWWVWFGLRSPAWLPKANGLLLLLLMVANAIGGDLFFMWIPHSVAASFHVVSLIIRLLFLLLIVLMVVEAIRKAGFEGLLVLPTVILLGISRFSTELGVLHVRLTWFPFGVQLTAGNLAELLLVFGMAVLLVRRLTISVHAQRLMAEDVKQAQEVQRVILPEALASYPGLKIESVYRPARQVGGDFFQIIPHKADNSVLIVAGDVAGKGLQAGMLVALLVGAIRTAAQYQPEPLAMLRALNLRLLGRGDAHATCLALRIDEEGNVTLANAGHMPPYLNGQPVAMEGALPLGMKDGAEFPVMRFRLQEGDRLVLMSDGIAEATAATGELFGFDRVHALLGAQPSAADLADAAQRFGQEDDISVISVIRSALVLA